MYGVSDHDLLFSKEARAVSADELTANDHKVINSKVREDSSSESCKNKKIRKMFSCQKNWFSKDLAIVMDGRKNVSVVLASLCFVVCVGGMFDRNTGDHQKLCASGCRLKGRTNCSAWRVKALK